MYDPRNPITSLRAELGQAATLVSVSSLDKEAELPMEVVLQFRGFEARLVVDSIMTTDGRTWTSLARPAKTR